ncbi:Caleosin-domain-containing protein [Gonapodya prolifera JEL478]|uniref:Caleosin-domain-containing protein n=1 Tax=Gonapodya prolifera (strain JEL478) TaxID=1344416 RepID=A0A139AC48_GONPJ|nr:Caleosin-domain-containing protein [Gonapodya prolifera JEL478]|eukprot:KXS14350.1 Caleosin-domain-containing protein [Gonapodya prolifera JEL478]
MFVVSAPATKEFPPPIGLDKLGNAGQPRAVDAATQEHTTGSKNNNKHLSVLQQHVAFFDRERGQRLNARNAVAGELTLQWNSGKVRDGDGIISMRDTFLGFRSLGFNILAVFIINVNFSYPTSNSWVPDPTFGVCIKNIHRAKHGSDSEAYDNEGRFVPQKFEEIFSKHDRDRKGALTFPELMRMIRAQRNWVDPFGWFAAFFEWGTLFLLCAKDGMISKEAVRRQYDGTLFYYIEQQIIEAKKSGKPPPHSVWFSESWDQYTTKKEK